MKLLEKTLKELFNTAIKSKNNISEDDEIEYKKLIDGEEHVKQLVEKAKKNGTPFSDIKRVLVRNKLYNKTLKQNKDVIIYRTVFINDDGEFDGLVCSMMDITKLLSDGHL